MSSVFDLALLWLDDAFTSTHFLFHLFLQYVGEAVDTAITEDRPESYLFGHSNEYNLDSFEQGGCTRYINHSSERPNVEVRYLFTNGGDKRVAFFASQYINAGQEVCNGYEFPLQEDDFETLYHSFLTYCFSALL